MAREASVERNTKETEIKLKLTLDGTGYSDIETGVGFFNHMLDGFTRHGLFDLCVRVHGDLEVGAPHTIDLSGRPYFSWDAEFTSEKIGDMSTEMVKEFFYAISYSCGMNLHIKVLTNGNSHHVAEAMFKSFSKALDQAVSYDPRITDVLSTKGSLA